MTGTKIVGGFCGTFLVFLLFRLGAEGLYHPGHSGYAEEVEQAYTIATAEGGSETPAEAAPPVDVEAILATGDAASGEKIFGKCKACHKIDGTNSTGPHLDGVYGRPVASVEGFSYSDALKGLGGEWTGEHLFHFIHKPKDYAPGTKMTFQGLPKDQDLADIIAYLKSLS